MSVEINTKLIINPSSGRWRAKKSLSKINKVFQNSCLKIDMFFTCQKGEATLVARQAVRNKYDLVIAAGGDGTINEVINGIIGSKAALGIIPIGTVNVFALEMGIPLDIVKACRVIIRNKRKIVDLGKADNYYFLLMAGIGFDAQVIQSVRLSLKRFIGRFAYIIFGLITFFRFKPIKLHINSDTENIKENGYLITIGNSKNYAGNFTITKNAKIDDGWLDVCIFKNNTKWAIFSYICNILRGKHIDSKDVVYFKIKTFSVNSDKPALVQVDGEVIGELPMSFEVVPKCVSIIIP